MLAKPELRQLRQRIVLRHSLRPFDAGETTAYVEERLRLAGYTGKGLFDKRALAELHEISGGIPRLVNVLCDGALLVGYARELDTLSRDVVQEVARDLALEPAGAPAVELDSAPRSQRRRLLGFFR
jgi:general secretion pathway protein A